MLATAPTRDSNMLRLGRAVERDCLTLSMESSSRGIPTVAASGLVTLCQPLTVVWMWVMVLGAALISPQALARAVTIVSASGGMTTVVGRSQTFPSSSSTIPFWMMVPAQPTILRSTDDLVGIFLLIPLILTTLDRPMPWAVV